MSSPIAIPYPSRKDASSGLYVPVHRRTPGSYTSSSSRTPSPSPSSSSADSLSLSPSPASTHHTLPALASVSIPGVYTPAELLLLSSSPLAKLSGGHMDARLRAIAPEVLQTRKQRKALAWHARQLGRTSSRGSHTSESDEDRATSWRRV